MAAVASVPIQLIRQANRFLEIWIEDGVLRIIYSYLTRISDIGSLMNAQFTINRLAPN